MRKTREEYETIAMLLGAVYRPHFHAFRMTDYKLAMDNYVDADSLEPLRHKEVLARISWSLDTATDEEIAEEFAP